MPDYENNTILATEEKPKHKMYHFCFILKFLSALLPCILLCFKISKRSRCNVTGNLQP